MPVMDEFKEERALMKEKPLKDRLSYFWYYYKIHVIFGVIALGFLGGYIYTLVTAKDTAFCAILINCSNDEYTVDPYLEALSQYLGLNPKKEAVVLDTTIDIVADGTVDYESTERLGVKIMAKEMDVMVADENTFNRYAQTDIFLDLRDVLSEEQLARYQDSFYYTDYALIESGYYDNIDYAEEAFSDTADHTSPEGMENPIPIGIYVTGDKEFQDNYYFRYGDTSVYGIAYYTENIDKALAFLDYMTGNAK